jgi:DNA topoisomerase-1
MGRVQSATLHLLCVREQAIQAFVPQDYWSIWVSYGEGFKAFYRSRLQPQRQQTKDIADDQKAEPESERVTSQARANELVAISQAHPHTVVRLEGKQTTQSPPPPFVASGERVSRSP